MKIYDFPTFHVPSYIYEEKIKGGPLAGPPFTISAIDNGERKYTDAMIILHFYNANYRELMLLVFMYNNRIMFTAKEFSLLLEHMEIQWAGPSIKQMSHYDFVEPMSALVSSLLDTYLLERSIDVEQAFNELDFPGDPFRFKNGINLLYSIYTRSIMCMVVENKEKETINLLENKWYPINGLHQATTDNDFIEYNKSLGVFDIFNNGEQSIYNYYVLYRTFINSTLCFHNAILEIIETDEYKDLPFLVEYFKKNFSADWSSDCRLQFVIRNLLGNNSKKYMVDIAGKVDPLIRKVFKNQPQYN